MHRDKSVVQTLKGGERWGGGGRWGGGERDEGGGGGVHMKKHKTVHIKKHKTRH